MAFIQQGTTFYSFADYDDVVAKDSRLFSANEGLTQDVVEDALIRSTTRILDMIRASDWWKSYNIHQTGSVSGLIIGQSILAPAVNPLQIKSRYADFTDLCVYHSLSEYLYPRVADFGNPDSAERQKIGFYNEKFRSLLQDIIDAGDWYDFTNNGTVTDAEKFPGVTNLVRVR